jgi:hypothetical protein
MLRLGMKGKLLSRFIGPFEVNKRVGLVAYKLVLPPHMAKIHDVFHNSLLRRDEVDPSSNLPQIPLKIDIDLTLEMKLVKVLDYSEKELRSMKILMIKVSQRNS